METQGFVSPKFGNAHERAYVFVEEATSGHKIALRPGLFQPLPAIH